MTSAADFLINLSPLDGRYRSQLADLRPLFSEYGLIRHRLEIEIEWLIWLAEREEIGELSPMSEAAKSFLRQLLNDFDLEQAVLVKQIENETRHDVKAVELYLRHKISEQNSPAELLAARSFIHLGCTSEDINNSAYALMVQRTRDRLLLPALKQLIDALAAMAERHADAAMVARTHGQLASPTTWGKEMAVFVQRLTDSVEHWQAIDLSAKFNGAVGNYSALSAVWPQADWPDLSASFVQRLGLTFNPCTTQIEPGNGLVRWLNELTLLNSVLIDLCRDLWGYVSLGYLKPAPPDKNEVGSSTMPHKVNPIDFENAEGNLSIAVGGAQTLAREIPLSRWQRDLAGSTRLRNLAVVLGHSLLAWRSLGRGLSRIEVDHDAMTAELSQHYQLLTEVAQTELRRAGHDNAYEMVKAVVHGQTLDQTAWHKLIKELPLPPEARNRLTQLSPLNYIGQAPTLARQQARNKPSDKQTETN